MFCKDMNLKIIDELIVQYPTPVPLDQFIKKIIHANNINSIPPSIIDFYVLLVNHPDKLVVEYYKLFQYEIISSKKDLGFIVQKLKKMNLIADSDYKFIPERIFWDSKPKTTLVMTPRAFRICVATTSPKNNSLTLQLFILDDMLHYYTAYLMRLLQNALNTNQNLNEMQRGIEKIVMSQQRLEDNSKKLDDVYKLLSPSF